MDNRTYERLYESQAQALGDESIGYGPFDAIGETELDLLRMEGLRPEHTLVDFGCGVGRLAVHAIPVLAGGAYIGTDISTTMLKRADERIRKAVPNPPCRVTWRKQTTPRFPLEDDSVDMMCAFSVFTHMEHEDSYRYLEDAARVVRPGGRLIFSCLLLDETIVQRIFREEAGYDLQTRWKRVRNITTSKDYMTQIARLAGWTSLRWYAGDEKNIRSATGEMRNLGQASCVLEAPRSRA